MKAHHQLQMRRAISLIEEAAAKYKNDPHGRLDHFLDNYQWEADIGRSRFVSQKRATEIGNILHLCLKELGKLRRPLPCLSAIRTKSIKALVKDWQAKGLAVGTIQDRLSVLRKFLRAIGRAEVLPKGEMWRRACADAGINTAGRHELPQMELGWDDLGIDPQAIIDDVALEHPVVALCMEMQLHFGLRLSESIQIQLELADKGTYLLVTRGTKGGKTREVPFSTNPERRKKQEDVLRRGKVFCKARDDGALAIPGMSLKQMKNHMRHVARKFGLTKKGKWGVTYHGLRHQFGTTEFKERTGMPAPVLRQRPMEDYYANWEVVRKAFIDIARAMGHERPSISGAYLGRVRALSREQHQQLRKWQDQFARQAEAFRDAGVEGTWIIGRCAEGLPADEDRPLELAVRLANIESAVEMVRRLEVLQQHLIHATQIALACFLWVKKDPPQGFELMLSSGKKDD